MVSDKLEGPQFECGPFEIWSLGIIDSLSYRAICGLDDLPYDVDDTLSLEQKLEKCNQNLNLDRLRSMKPELYDILLSKTGYLMRKHCADFCDTCDKMTFKSRFIQLVFLHILQEEQFLAEFYENYYESVLHLFPNVTFGPHFFIDVIADQGWYKYSSKLLTDFANEDQIEKIKSGLSPLSAHFHLNVLFVIWAIENVFSKCGDNQALLEFKTTSDNLLKQCEMKNCNLKNNLAIYLALVNVTLEEYLGAVARQAARTFDMHKKHETEDEINPVLHKLEIDIPCIEVVITFINELGRKLFPNQEIENIENIQSCFMDPKSESIIEMIVSIIDTNKFSSILRKEVTFPKVKFEAYDKLMDGWNEWSHTPKFVEVLCQELSSLKRFFAQEREESRYLTCLIIKHGLPKYFDILETIDIELFYDPFVIYTFCDVLQTKTESRCDADKAVIEEMIPLLKLVLTTIKSKKRISSLVKVRAKFFNLYAIGEVKTSQLTKLLRQVSGSVKYDQVRDEILLAAFLSPYEVLDFIIGDTLEHAHHMIPFLSKLFCFELNGFTSLSCDTRYNNSFFEMILNDRINILTTANTLSGFLSLISEVTAVHCNSKKSIQPATLVLDRLFLLVVWDNFTDVDIVVDAKVAVYKLIKNLSDQYQIPWAIVAKEPCGLLYNLINMLDYYYEDGSGKVPFIELIAYTMNKKVQRKLTTREYYWMEKRAEYFGDSTILLAYLAPWLEERLSFYIDVSKLSLNATLLLAAICKDNIWIWHATKRDLNSETNGFLWRACGSIMRFLCRSEYDNLFYFLNYYALSANAMLELVESFVCLETSAPANLEYIVKCITECLYFHYEEQFINPDKYIPIRYKTKNIEYVPYTKEELITIVWRRAAVLFYYRGYRGSYPESLKSFLVKISKEMKEMNIDVHKTMFATDVIYHPYALLALKMYHSVCYYIPEPPKPPKLRPG